MLLPEGCELLVDHVVNGQRRCASANSLTGPAEPRRVDHYPPNGTQRRRDGRDSRGSVPRAASSLVFTRAGSGMRLGPGHAGVIS